MTDSNNNKKAPTGSWKAVPMSMLGINPLILQEWFIGLLIWVPAKSIRQVLKCKHIMALGFHFVFFSLRSVPQEKSLLQSAAVFLAYLLTYFRDIIKTFSEKQNKAKTGSSPLPHTQFFTTFWIQFQRTNLYARTKAFWHYFPSEWLQIRSLGYKPSLPPNLLLITVKQNRAALNTQVCLNGGSSWSEKREWLSSPRDKFSAFG